MRILFLSNRVNSLRARISNTFTLPDRLKGTVIEKWAKYWQGVVSDYKEVVTGVVKEAQTKPRKAVLWGGLAYALYAAAKRNPDEEELMRSVRNWDNKMIMVPAALQNPVSAEYLRQIEQAVNQNRLRTLSLGICTLLWVDLYDKDDCTYPAICEYTNIGFRNFHEHVIDIGFWNHFWRLEWKMINYDVNYL